MFCTLFCYCYTFYSQLLELVYVSFNNRELPRQNLMVLFAVSPIHFYCCLTFYNSDIFVDMFPFCVYFVFSILYIICILYVFYGLELK